MFDAGKFNFEALDESGKTFCLNTSCSDVVIMRNITVNNYIKQKSSALINLRQQNYIHTRITEQATINILLCKEQLKDLSKISPNEFKQEALLMVDLLDTIKPNENSNFYNHFCKVQKSILDTINKYL